MVPVSLMIRNPDLCKAKMEEVQDQELQNLSFSNLTSDTQVFNEETKSINTLKSVQSVEIRYEENESLETIEVEKTKEEDEHSTFFNFALLCIEK